VKIQPLGRTTLPAAIVEQIRTQILLGELPPGSQIPSERELATGFGVNRTTVREALMELARLRLLERKQGRRCTVLDWRETGSIELLVHVLRLPRGSGVREEAAASFFDALLVAYRTAIELISAREPTLDEVRAQVVAIEAAIAASDADRVLAADRAFHSALFRETRSIVFELMFLTLYRAVEDGLDLGGSYGRRAAAEYIRRGARGPRLPHRAVLDALDAGDPDKARSVVDRVVSVMRDIYQSGSQPPPPMR